MSLLTPSPSASPAVPFALLAFAAAARPLR